MNGLFVRETASGSHTLSAIVGNKYMIIAAGTKEYVHDLKFRIISYEMLPDEDILGPFSVATGKQQRRKYRYADLTFNY